MPQHYIYWEDPLESEFRVTVTSCRRTERGYEITIDEHVARPEGGGQAGDRGTLEVGGAIVRFVDTVEDNGSVVLICEAP
ncbi:MAG: alanyl-tRNA editing protein, partial [Candidatus Thorarchaeota archaeon]